MTTHTTATPPFRLPHPQVAQDLIAKGVDPEYARMAQRNFEEIERYLTGAPRRIVTEDNHPGGSSFTIPIPDGYERLRVAYRFENAVASPASNPPILQARFNEASTPGYLTTVTASSLATNPYNSTGIFAGGIFASQPAGTTSWGTLVLTGIPEGETPILHGAVCSSNSVASGSYRITGIWTSDAQITSLTLRLTADTWRDGASFYAWTL